MQNRGHALSRDELVRVLTAYTGVTTADGAAGGTTLIDSNLIDNPLVSPTGIANKTILIATGNARGEAQGATLFNNANGTVTFPAFSAQILAGTVFRIVNFSAASAALIAAIEAKLDFVIPSATFVYLDAGAEQAVFTFNPTRNSSVHTIWLDLSTLTQNTTIRIKIGGVTTETFNWTTGMDDGVYFRNIALDIGRTLQVTLQETADEGADRNIPYYYGYEER